MRAPSSGAYSFSRTNRPDEDIFVGNGGRAVPMVSDHRTFHRLRSEKNRQNARGRGFDSRHLHPTHWLALASTDRALGQQGHR